MHEKVPSCLGKLSSIVQNLSHVTFEASAEQLTEVAAQMTISKLNVFIAKLEDGLDLSRIGGELVSLGTQIQNHPDFCLLRSLVDVAQKVEPVLRSDDRHMAQEHVTQLAMYLQSTINQRIEAFHIVARNLGDLGQLCDDLSQPTPDFAEVHACAKKVQSARFRDEQAKLAFKHYQEAGLAEHEALKAVRDSRQALWTLMSTHGKLLNNAMTLASTHFPELLPSLAAGAAQMFASLGPLLKNRLLSDYDYSPIQLGRIYKAKVKMQSCRAHLTQYYSTLMIQNPFLKRT